MFLTVKLINHCNNLHRDMMDSPLLGVLKRLDIFLKYILQLKEKAAVSGRNHLVKIYGPTYASDQTRQSHRSFLALKSMNEYYSAQGQHNLVNNNCKFDSSSTLQCYPISPILAQMRLLLRHCQLIRVSYQPSLLHLNTCTKIQ